MKAKIIKALKQFKDFLYKEIKAHDCPNCGAMIFDKNISDRWVRGHNHLCRQASSDRGWYCDACQKVHFKDSLEEHLKKLPDWCSVQGRIGQGTKSGFTEYEKEYLLPDGKYAK